MSTPLYPGVSFTETDLTTTIDQSLSSIPGFVIRAQKGPIEVPVLITNEQELREIFGEPFNGTLATDVTFNNLKDWFSVSNFLSYSNGAYVCRVEIDSADAAFNASLETDGTTVDNTTDNSTNVKDGSNYDAVTTFTADNLGIFAKNPGYWGNNISVALYITGTTDTTANKGGSSSAWYTWKAANTDFAQFEQFPIYGASAGLGEVAIIVYYNDVIVEKFICTLNPDGKNEFNENYYIGDYLKKYSKYISAYVYNAAGYVAGMTTGFVKTALANGVLETGDNWADADVLIGLDKYSNPEEIDIDFLVDGGFNSATVANYIAGIVADRKDCFGIIGARVSDIQNQTTAAAVTNLIAYKKTLSITGTTATYCGFYGNIKKMYNKFSDKYFWISVSSDVAGLMARTDTNFFPWFATAGSNRGVLQNVTSLGFNPTDTQVGQLYSNNINTIKFDPDSGNIINGNRTLYTFPSAFRDINVRRLFTYCENAILRSTKAFLYEFNDEITRNNIYSIVNNFMTTVKTNRGVYDFRAICDTTNNTPDVIDNNELYLDVLIKPSRTIENISIRFVATRTDANFEELISGIS
jgi:phage tail sheath protein FI